MGSGNRRKDWDSPPEAGQRVLGIELPRGQAKARSREFKAERARGKAGEGRKEQDRSCDPSVVRPVRVESLGASERPFPIPGFFEAGRPVISGALKRGCRKAATGSEGEQPRRFHSQAQAEHAGR